MAIDMSKKIALIVPVFNEAEGLPIFYEKVMEVITNLAHYQWHIIFVDDGSQDKSWPVIQHLAHQHANITGLLLSRNFGKEVALTAGVEFINNKVDAVICMDADLQHPPELLPKILEQWEAGFEIVATIREDAEDYSMWKRVGSKIFYALMSRFSDLNIPPHSTDYRLLDKKVVSVLCQFTERTRMFRGLTDWMGFHKTYLMFVAPARSTGVPMYSFNKLFHLAINSLTSFSLLPLRITGYLGLLIMFSAGALLGYMLFSSIFLDMFYTHMAFFVVFNTLLMGVLLSGLGLVALYIGHIHTEVVQRPLYILKETCKAPEAKDSFG